MNREDFFKRIISHAKEYGFIFQGSEIYDGLNGVYDYGPLGAELKNNVKSHWWKSMVQMHRNIVGLDASILMHPKVWKASGHVDAFNDPLIDNKDSRMRYRADQLIEDYAEKLVKKKRTKEAEELLSKLKVCMEKNDLKGMYELIAGNKIVCPVSGTSNWTEVRQFNLMFSTKLGSVAEEADEIYLRPETAQGIFVNFLNAAKTARQKIPFGIAQTGKAFRNEIVARQFVFRMREFEQMEMQFFVKPGTEMQWYDYWKNVRMQWYRDLGIEENKLRFKDHRNLAHYANAAVDVEYEFPIGFKEVEGVHSRTDYDLKRHQEFSGKKMEYYDTETKESYIPYVVETSCGVERITLMLLCNAYREEEIIAQDRKEMRVVLSLKPSLAPYKIGIFPLNNRDGLPEIAEKIFNELKNSFTCFYEEKDTIGRRYRRQDIIGTPFGITVDYDTPKDNTVTIRDRDTMKQERIPIEKIAEYISEKIK